MDERVMHRETGRKGRVVGELSAVAEEDGFGDMNYDQLGFLWVVWDDSPRIPEHVSRQMLIPVVEAAVEENSAL